jgi:hypothetical protein
MGGRCGGDVVNIVAYGGGTNSTAMLIGMWNQKIPVDLILFADTGGERPETYAYIRLFDKWLKERGVPGITIVEYVDENGDRLTLEQECLRCGSLPSIAYGFKRCSLKHKRGTQEKYCNNCPACKAVWDSGQRVNKFIGYDAGERQRKNNAIATDIVDKKYHNLYPLIDEWDWGRDECMEVIVKAGLPLPGKSSCFFCPSMKKPEIKSLYLEHPDLFARALAIEENAKPNLQTVKGLGRDWSWREYIEAQESQITFFNDDIGVPCGCYDG